jgi:SagB-type dehydrogenase family enzyme
MTSFAHSKEKVDTVLAYHQATKHHFGRYARSAGYMDWPNQPNPFRFYAGAERILLPLAETDPNCPYDALFTPPAEKGTPLTLESVGSFLELSMGLSAWKAAGTDSWSLRINPSSGNLHPTECHLILPACTGIGGGVYHYAPYRHEVERRARLPDGSWLPLTHHFGGPGFLVALTTIFWRESWKYGERAYRYCNLDVGHALAAVSFAARLHGWKAVCLSGTGDDQIGTLLGFPHMAWPAGGAEEPDVICWISTVPSERTVPQQLPDRWERFFCGHTFAGQPSPLSQRVMAWPIIDAVARAAHRPAARPDTIDNVPLPAQCGQVDPVAASAAAIIRRRRSAGRYDPGRSISAASFFSILDRTLCRADAPPFDVLLAASDVNLLLFVHRVDGLAPGLYFLGRESAADERCSRKWRDDFLWNRAHDQLPLWLLKEMDLTIDAMELSCHQEIAGNGAFAVAMIARFEERLRHAAWAYRRLLWECGLIGQVLYLEAEARGIRGTGIGCFFDDPVHDFLGIDGLVSQSLYHFTVGHPMEDTRLSTLPAYHHLKH